MKEETTDYTVSEDTEPTEVKMNETEDRKDEKDGNKKEEKEADFSFTVKANFKDVFVIVVLILMAIYFFRGCEILLKRLENKGINIESFEQREVDENGRPY